MNCKPLLLLFIITLSCFACHKNNEANTKVLLQGTWNGESVISKQSINNNINTENNPPVITYDTLLCSPDSVHSNLIIKGDSVNYYAYLNQDLSFAMAGGTYTLHNNTIVFTGNLFSLSANPLIIQTLASNKLVLYDKDTTNLSPLVINEQWITFYK